MPKVIRGQLALKVHKEILDHKGQQELLARKVRKDHRELLALAYQPVVLPLRCFLK